MVTARLALLSLLALALVGCSMTTAYAPPGLDYPPGAYRAPGGAPRPVAETFGR